MPAIDVTGTRIADLLDLDGRVALVTGGARGIGRACCWRLAEAGAAAAVCDKDLELAEKTATEIRKEGGNAIAVELDVTSLPSVRAGLGEVTAQLGTVDILVNNAGIYPPAALDQLSDEAWNTILAVNLSGAVRMSREVAGQMVNAGHGVIINITSIAAFIATNAGLAAYTSTKHGLWGLTKSLAIELGPKGVRVLAVAPGMVETEGILELRAKQSPAKLGDTSKLGTDLPLGRSAVPDDIARAVLFAASDMACLMTGSTLAVDSGYLAS